MLMLSFKEYLIENILSRTEIFDKIGKTRMLAMSKHPFFKDYIYPETLIREPVFKHDKTKLGDHRVYAASSHRRMVKFDFYKHKVSNAHLYHWDGQSRHENGQKKWEYIKSYKNDD